MKFNRSRIVALCLGVALLVMTGSAMAGTTNTYAVYPTGSAGAITFARELATSTMTYSFPGLTCGSSEVTHAMSLIRAFNSGGTPQNYFFDITLDQGATFVAVPAAQDAGPASGIPYVVGEPSIQVTRIIDGTVYTNTPTSKVRYFVRIIGPEASVLPVIHIPLNLFKVRDNNNVLYGGGTINITVATFEAATGVPQGTPIDASATDMAFFMTGGWGVSLSPAFGEGAAVIDVTTTPLPRTNFVANSAGTVMLTHDGSANIGISTSPTGVYFPNGCAFTLSAMSSIQLVITGNFSGVTSITYGDGLGGAGASSATTFTSPVTINIPANNTNFNGTKKYFTLNVNGTSALIPQNFTFALNEVISPSDASWITTALSVTRITSGTVLTRWSLSGTTLTAIWVNGNHGFFNARLYIWNPSTQSGTITATVYSLPTPLAAATAPSVVLGSTTISQPVPGPGGLNIRVYEDILLNIPAIPDPYTVNGGNLLIVLNITAGNCAGWANTFHATLSYGMATMVNYTY